MTKHLLCLTVDTDPDGLSGKVTDRRTLRWEGLEHLRQFPEEVNDFDGKLGRVPITWFVRADGQLESILGNSAYLLEAYGNFWTEVKRSGDELGWHPHLYRQESASDAVVLITCPQQAQNELERLWKGLKSTFGATVFRNGEGWHTLETFDTVERLGFRCDSTAIPGRKGGNRHPMNWAGAPNQPYFPASNDLCKSGTLRSMLELPMNTWQLKAPHDEAPRVRYMNPAVHCQLFANGLKTWENTCKLLLPGLYVWVMIFHPDDVLVTQGPDALYARSRADLCRNLVCVTETLRRLDHGFEWVTVSDAAERWRGHQQGRSA